MAPRPSDGPMTTRPLPTLRLDLKRAFSAYLIALNSPGIADPTQAFLASYDYLAALLNDFGVEGFLYRLDDETTHLAGEVDQDLRHKLRDRRMDIEYVEVEDRLRECFEYALGQLDALLTRLR
jgi:hypothetical protein